MKRLAPYTKVILHYVQALRNAAKLKAGVENSRLKPLQPRLQAGGTPYKEVIYVTPNQTFHQGETAIAQGMELGHSEYENILTNYYHLATLPELSELDIKRLKKILAAAQADEQLSCLINETDKLVCQQLGLLERDSWLQQRMKPLQTRKTLQKTTESKVPQYDPGLPAMPCHENQLTPTLEAGHEEILAAYYHLATLPELSEVDAKRLEKILAAAQADAQLSYFINEIDELTFQQLGFLEEEEHSWTTAIWCWLSAGVAGILIGLAMPIIPGVLQALWNSPKSQNPALNRLDDAYSDSQRKVVKQQLFDVRSQDTDIFATLESKNDDLLIVNSLNQETDRDSGSRNIRTFDSILMATQSRCIDKFSVMPSNLMGGADTEWNFSLASFKDSSKPTHNHSLSFPTTTTHVYSFLDKNLCKSMTYFTYEPGQLNASFKAPFDHIVGNTTARTNVLAVDLETLILAIDLRTQIYDSSFIVAYDVPEPSAFTAVFGIGLIMLYQGFQFQRRKNQRTKSYNLAFWLLLLNFGDG